MRNLYRVSIPFTGRDQIANVHLPEESLGAHTQVLKHKPEARFALVIVQTSGVDGQASDQIPRVHGVRLLRLRSVADGLSHLAVEHARSVSRSSHGCRIGGDLSINRALLTHIHHLLRLEMLSLRLGRWWVRRRRRATDTHSGTVARCPHHISLSICSLCPQVHLQNEERRIRQQWIIHRDLCVGVHVNNHQLHAWWGCDGPPVFVTKATHPRSLRLL